MKLSYGIIVGLCAILACLSLALWKCEKEIKGLQEVQVNLQNDLAKCESALSVQNSLVTIKQKELENYSSQITQIQADFKQKSSELDKSIKEVKNCEQGMSYLRKMLLTLKGI